MTKGIEKFGTLELNGRFSDICSTIWNVEGSGVSGVVVMDLLISNKHVVETFWDTIIFKFEHQLSYLKHINIIEFQNLEFLIYWISVGIENIF